MATSTQSYKCEFCGKLYDNIDMAKIHEESCKKAYEYQEEQNRLYREKRQQRLDEACDISRRSEGIALLVKHKLFGDASMLCKEHVRFLWDCGTSSGWESVYTTMIQVHDSSYENH